MEEKIHLCKNGGLKIRYPDNPEYIYILLYSLHMCFHIVYLMKFLNHGNIEDAVTWKITATWYSSGSTIFNKWCEMGANFKLRVCSKTPTAQTCWVWKQFNRLCHGAGSRPPTLLHDCYTPPREKLWQEKLKPSSLMCFVCLASNSTWTKCFPLPSLSVGFSVVGVTTGKPQLTELC